MENGTRLKLGKISKSTKVLHILALFLVLVVKISLVFSQDRNYSNYPRFEFLQKQPSNCGRLEIDPLDIRTFAPWSVAVFRRVAKNKWEFHTTGIIFGSRFIYSVQVGPIGRFPTDKNPGNFFIVAGVNTTDFSKHDQHAQYSKVIFVKPLYADFSSYSHTAIYHLEKPLVESPYVKEICFPFFANNIRFSSGLFDAIKNAVQLEFITYGFARSQRKYQSNTNNRTEDSKEWRLIVWKGITLKPETCKSIFQFYYGKTTFNPICGMRNTNGRGGIIPFAGRLDKIKFPNQGETDDELDLMCHGTGTGIMLSFGSLWFVGHPIRAVPGEKKMRCGHKTAYFSREYDITQVEPYSRWMYNVFRCGADSFSCKDYKKCVPLPKVCDQNTDCDDNSDEDPALCDWRSKNSLLTDRYSEIGFYSLPSKSRKIGAKTDVGFREVSANPKKCPKLYFPTEGIRCRTLSSFDSSSNSDLQQVRCDSIFSAGQRVFVDCDEFYTAPKFSFESLNLHCNETGRWTGLDPTSIVCQKKCGVYERRKKDANSGFPWNVRISYSGTQLCGGTLIQDNFVLTHARCVKNWIENLRKQSLYEILIRPLSSDYNRNFESNSTFKSQIDDVWISVNNLPNKYESGVALVKLRTPVSTNEKNAPIAACYLIPPFSRVVSGQRLIGIGSRSASELRSSSRSRSEIAPNLNQNLNFAVVPAEKCEFSRPIVEKNEFCATYFQDSAGDEQSEVEFSLGMGIGIDMNIDRGGGSQEKTAHVLVGILSSSRDGRSIFMEVNSFSDWILDILELHS